LYIEVLSPKVSDGDIKLPIVVEPVKQVEQSAVKSEVEEAVLKALEIKPEQLSITAGQVARLILHNPNETTVTVQLEDKTEWLDVGGMLEGRAELAASKSQEVVIWKNDKTSALTENKHAELRFSIQGSPDSQYSTVKVTCKPAEAITTDEKPENHIEELLKVINKNIESVQVDVKEIKDVLNVKGMQANINTILQIITGWSVCETNNPFNGSDRNLDYLTKGTAPEVRNLLLLEHGNPVDYKHHTTSEERKEKREPLSRTIEPSYTDSDSLLQKIVHDIELLEQRIQDFQLEANYSEQLQQELKKLQERLNSLTSSPENEKELMHWAQDLYQLKRKITDDWRIADDNLVQQEMSHLWEIVRQKYRSYRLEIIDELGPFDPYVHTPISTVSNGQGKKVVKVLEIGFQRSSDAPKGAGRVLDKARVRRGD
jgi:exonuclease VII small subunit